MKKLLFLCALSLVSSMSVFGQNETLSLPTDSLTGKILYSGIVYVDSLVNKQELFSRTREWFAKIYNSSTDVIQMEDKESGKIIGKAKMQVTHIYLKRQQPGGYINYTISLYIKDGRYKYEITDFYHTGQYVGAFLIPDAGACEKIQNEKKGFGALSYKKSFELYLYQMDEKVKGLIISLKESLSAKSTNNKKNEW